MIENYNTEVVRWAQRIDRDADLDDFVVSDDTKIKWSRTLKAKLKRGQSRQNFRKHKVRQSLYRPFTKSHSILTDTMNE